MIQGGNPGSTSGGGTARTCRVLVVDDDHGMLDLIAEVLQRAGHDVATADSVAQARAMVGDGYDAAVLDVGLPDGQGFEILSLLRCASPPCASLIVTGRTDALTAAHSVNAGVSEFLAKPFRNDDLVTAVEATLVLTERFRGRMDAAREGRRVEPPARPGNGRGGLRFDTAEAGDTATQLAIEGRLTERERETLEFVLLGLSNPQIARELDISANTVKYHVKNLLTKLGLDSRADLLRYIVERAR